MRAPPIMHPFCSPFPHFTFFLDFTFPQHSTGIALLCLQNSTFYWHCLQVHFLYWITRPLREAGWWTLINLFWTSSFSAIEHPSTSNKDWEIAPYMPSDTPKYVRTKCFVLFLTNSPRQIYHSCFFIIQGVVPLFLELSTALFDIDDPELGGLSK